MRVALLCLTTYASSCMAWSSYKSKIPNGNMGGVGHSSCTSPSSCSGGGGRNAFGSAFASAGRSWTKALCEADSDGDGKSNGLELGDPCCVWTTGATPQFETDLSAPGASGSATSRNMPDCTPPTPAPTPPTPAPTPPTPAPTGGTSDTGGSSTTTDSSSTTDDTTAASGAESSGGNTTASSESDSGSGSSPLAAKSSGARRVRAGEMQILLGGHFAALVLVLLTLLLQLL